MNDLEQFGLNERQANFVRVILEGSTPAAAAREAGYSHQEAAGYLVKNPQVLAAIHHGIQRALQTDAPVSLKVLREIRDDTEAPARVRADIGIKLMQLAGHVMPRTATSAAEKPLSEMTRDEMVAFIERNQAAIDRAADELANRAKDVSPAPSVPSSVPKSTPADAKSLDYLD